MFTGGIIQNNFFVGTAHSSTIPQDRGAFMSIISSVQQISGGMQPFIAGLIVAEGPGGKLLHYDTLGYVVVGAMFITVLMMYLIHLQVEKSVKQKVVVQPQQ